MRIYELFRSSPHNDFIYGLSKLARPQKNEFSETLFQIYDFSNKNKFGVEELITFVR